MTFLMHRKPVVLVDNRRSVLKPSEPDYCGVLADRLKVKCDGERPCTRCVMSLGCRYPRSNTDKLGVKNWKNNACSSKYRKTPSQSTTLSYIAINQD